MFLRHLVASLLVRPVILMNNPSFILFMRDPRTRGAFQRMLTPLRSTAFTFSLLKLTLRSRFVPYSGGWRQRYVHQQ